MWHLAKIKGQEVDCHLKSRQENILERTASLKVLGWDELSTFSDQKERPSGREVDRGGAGICRDSW